MADKLRLNKSSLREQNKQLRSYLEFLPTLRLRQQQLQAALGRVQQQLRVQQQHVQQQRAHARPWAPLLAAQVPAARPFAEVERVVTQEANVAGVTVPRLHAVCFVSREHDLLATAPVFDDAVAVLRRMATLRAEGDVLQVQQERIRHELARTSQRINLYEKILVPRARKNIRRLRVYLGDQQTAAVCRAKLAKGKVEAGRGARAQGGAYGDR
ncbi:MAG: V-type ATP synthase subunit D [Myxococcota bacterium]